MGDNFNENLKASREKRGMTQKEVADIIGVRKIHLFFICKVETGTQCPNYQKKLLTL